MKDYRDEPVCNREPPKPLNPVHINAARIMELQDSLNSCLCRILDGLSGNATPHMEASKPCGLIETTEILVEQAKCNCDLANTIYDMLLGER